ncbi:hypothetical protein BDV93DRAFT_565858 [Ceratobasidium sp. AG-I]|nr:hypothetical protein BDV93DRAFT_565858 [Ceratobasidium sp. AG-I]
MSYLFKPEIPQFPRLTQNGDNFESWRQDILAMLELIDLGNFVAAGMKGTAREDALARREVRSHLTPALITYAIDFPTTRDLWTALATRFAPGAPTAQPHDLPRHKATKDAKEGGDGHGEQGEGRGNGRGRRRGRKPAVRSEDATRATNDRPGSRVEVRTHNVATPSTSSVPADDGTARHEPSTIVHQHNEREDTHAYNTTIPSPQDSKTAPQGDLDTPGATQIVHHDREDAYERSVAVPEALDVYNESKAIERRDDTQATTYASNATQESNPDAPGDEATPDNAPTQLDTSDVFSSHRIAKLRDPEPTTLDNAGPDPFRVGEGDIRRKSTSRDGAFDEGETAYQGVETNRSQQPVDEGTVRIEPNGGEATRLDVPSRPDAPTRPPEAIEYPNCGGKLSRRPPEVQEASESFERPTDSPGPPIHLPEAAEPSQASQTTPNPPNRPSLTRHALERDDDLSRGVHHADDVPTPLLTTHDARSAPQSAPEWVDTTPSVRTRAPTVFDDGGESLRLTRSSISLAVATRYVRHRQSITRPQHLRRGCDMRHKVIEDSGVPVDGGIVSSAQNDGEDEITNVPSRPTSPAHSPDATQPPEPLETYPASPELMGDTLEHTGSVRHADDAPAEAAEAHEARRTLHNANDHIRGRITPTPPNPACTDLHDAPAETATTHKVRLTDRDEVGNERARNAPIASNSVHTSPSDTPGDRIAPSTHPKSANGASKRTRHARIHAYNDLQMPCVRASVFDFILLFFIHHFFHCYEALMHPAMFDAG